MREWAQEEGLPAFDQEAQTGYLRHLVVREGRNTGQALVQLVTAPGDLQGDDRLVDGAAAAPRGALDPLGGERPPAEVTNLPTNLLWGEEAIEEELLGLRYRIRPNAFLQTNTAMAERLYELAIEYAGLTGGETVYDLYCGIGTIGLSMASRALTVWGVEANEESVACAIENAGLNGVTNAAFFAGEVGRSLEELAERAGPPDVVVVDPPRGGPVREGAARARAPRGAEDRLRLLQPDDAGREREGARRRLGLPARALAPGGHVPAHAARRERVAAGARRAVDRLEPVTAGRVRPRGPP